MKRFCIELGFGFSDKWCGSGDITNGSFAGQSSRTWTAIRTADKQFEISA
ncbi:MAG: hypothetical protein K6U09_10115 [Acidobacteriia bacterium]|jgi:hypothetical protein|nr:hypothetical protein [Terriglobia bacterium]